MRFLAPLAIFVLAQTAVAATHTLEVRVSQGKTRFVKRLRLAAERSFKHVGPVTSTNRRAKRMLIFNVLMNEDPDGLEMQYQLELSGVRKSKERSIQAQGVILMRPGERARVLRCGPWRVRFTLDPRKGRKSVSNWKRGNYRVTVKFGGKKSGMSCSQITRSGSQSNVVYGIPRGRKKFGDIMNMLLMVTPSGTAALQYQLEHSRPNWGKPTQMQGDRRLKLGKPDISGGRNKRLELLVEGNLPEPKSKKKKPARSKSKKAPVRLLR